jgi:thiamine-phosphate pyrophosphorylase
LKQDTPDLSCKPLVGTAPDRLCAIVDAGAAARAGWQLIDLAQAFLDGGARFLQLRAKSMSGAGMLQAATAIVRAAHRCGAQVVINDRADIARLAEADGVHLGQEDLPPADVRAVLGGQAIVGLSTHSIDQLERAANQPISYLAIGPVFGTATKATGYDAVGLAMVREASRHAGARGLPLVAIGGITLDRAASVIEAGAASVAVIGDLLSTGDPKQRTREFLARLAPATSDPRRANSQ